MEAGVFGWLFFALFIISTPIYLFVLAVIVRYRNVPPFNGPFFTISVSIGIFDMLHLVPGWLTGRFANFAWYGVNQFVQQQPAFWAKFESMIWWYAGLGQTLGVPLLAVARMFTIAYGHEVTPLVLRAMLAAQWLIPAAITLPQWWCDFDYIRSNNTEDEGVLMQWVQHEYKDYYFTGCIWWCVVMALASGGCFAVTFRSVYATKADIARHITVSKSTRLIEIKLALVGFILFILTVVYGIYCGVEAKVHGAEAQMFMLRLQFILGDIYSWINAYLLLACSGVVRKYSRAMLLCKKPESASVAPKSEHRAANKQTPLKNFDSTRAGSTMYAAAENA